MIRMLIIGYVFAIGRSELARKLRLELHVMRASTERDLTRSSQRWSRCALVRSRLPRMHSSSTAVVKSSRLRPATGCPQLLRGPPPDFALPEIPPTKFRGRMSVPLDD